MSTTILTAWRQNLVTRLTSQFPSATVVSGERAGTSRDVDKIAVFWPGIKQWQPDVNYAQPRMTIRYWPAQPRTDITTSPLDPSPLESAADNLMDALQPVLSTLTTGLFFQVESITPDYDMNEWAIEAQLVGWIRSPMQAGG